MSDQHIEIVIDESGAPEDVESAAAGLKTQLAERAAAEDTLRAANVESERRVADETRRRIKAEDDARTAQAGLAEAEVVTQNAQLDSLTNALKTAEETGARLAKDNAAALTDGNFAKSSEISLQIAEVGGTIANLKAGKAQLEEQIKTRPAPKDPRDPANRPAQSDEEKQNNWLASQHPVNAAWIRQNRAKFFGDPAFQAKATAASGYVFNILGIKPEDPTYIQKVEEHLGIRTAAEPVDKVSTAAATEVGRQGGAAAEPPPRQVAPARAAAPPSRTSPTQNGGDTSTTRVTLTPEEIALAKQTFTPDIIGKNADGTPRDPVKAYAAQKLQLIKEGRVFQNR